jgi:hypothetical protein
MSAAADAVLPQVTVPLGHTVAEGPFGLAVKTSPLTTQTGLQRARAIRLARSKGVSLARCLDSFFVRFTLSL